jgi:serine phosphatase RsbU (regulator of sigma subunit)
MSLRVRLIVAFFLLSVVPLGAVTFYSYTSNVNALKQAAARETDVLAGELGARMQVVTTQLTQRLERLMEISPEPQTPAVVRASASRAAAPAPAVAAPEGPPDASAEFLASALGEVALLLKNVELRGLPGPTGGGRGRPPRPPGSSEGSRSGRSDAGGAPAVQPMPAVPAMPRVSDVQPPGSTNPRPDATSGSPRTRSQQSRRGSGAPGAPTPPSGVPTPTGGASPASPPPPPAPAVPPSPVAAPPGPSGPPAPQNDDLQNPMRVDLQAIRREVMKQLAPDGKLENLTPEQKQRLGRELTQRIQGIVQGIKLGAEEVQRRAEEAKREAEVKSKEDAAKAASASAGSASASSARSASLSSNKAVSIESKPPAQKKMAISGGRVDVTIEEGGKIVRRANAEIDLPNLLDTVFSTTHRDRGEVPFAVAKDGQIYTPTEGDRLKVEALGDIARPDSATGTATLRDWVVVTTSDPTGSGLKLGIARPVGDSMDNLRRAAARNAGLGLLFIGIALAGIVPLSGRLTRNLSTLTDGVSRIAHGDYRARVNVTSRDEIGQLATAFNRMAADVEQHQRAAVEQERIKRELELGRQIQHDMLPHAPLKLGLTEIKGISVPAREVGGDFFNYFQLPNSAIALIVGDVSGKGVGAALLMANIQASLRTRLALGQDLSAVAEEIDRDIENNSPGPVYATLFIATLDPVTRRLRYVNAGHHPQFILRGRGGLEQMSSTGLPVGLFAGKGHRQVEVQLAEGDLIFFYTDGLVEAHNENGDLYGTERLEALLTGASAATADAVLQQVERAVERFRGSRELFDDVTFMAVRVG